MAKSSLKEFSEEVRRILLGRYQIAPSDADKVSALVAEAFAIGDLPQDVAEDIGSIIAQIDSRKIVN